MKKLILLLLPLCLLLSACKKPNSQSNEEVQEISLPYHMDNGKIIIESLFESTIMNVDASNNEGEDIASLELSNNSNEFLDHATITLTMSDNETYVFEVEDIPANTKAWVFDTKNQTHKDTTITSIDYSTSYLDKTPIKQEEIETSVNGSQVTLKNLTDHDITNITVVCHATFDHTIYGGIVYLYNIQLLPANQSVSFEAIDCFLDSVEVTGIAY